MGFSILRRVGLPETSHIMWIVFMINFQSSPLFGRVPKDSLHHYHVSYPWTKKRELGTPKLFVVIILCPSCFVLTPCFQSFIFLAPFHFFIVDCITDVSHSRILISYSWFHCCLPWLCIVIWSSQFNILLYPSPQTKDLVQICAAGSSCCESPVQKIHPDSLLRLTPIPYWYLDSPVSSPEEEERIWPPF